MLGWVGLAVRGCWITSPSSRHGRGTGDGVRQRGCGSGKWADIVVKYGCFLRLYGFDGGNIIYIICIIYMGNYVRSGWDVVVKTPDAVQGRKGAS